MAKQLSREERSDRSAPQRLDWHAVTPEQAIDRLGTDAEHGLEPAEAERRLAEHGHNRLPEEAPESAVIRFLKQFHNVLIYILIGAAILTAFLGEWIDTGVIAAVVLVNALIGFIQEGKAEQALEGIRKMLSLEATVIRGGHRDQIPADEVVPGDIVVLEGGDRVPADLRLLSVRNGRIEEAALTGESVPVGKSTDPVDANALLGDRKGMAYSGTLVTSGQLRGVVIATGETTEIGRIGTMVARVEAITTPLLQKIDRFGKQLSTAILVLSALLFVYGWLVRGYALEELFLIVVSFAVAVIPEGLPAILTITLALGVQRMARRNAIIRRLPAVETLGSVSSICSDKTGTLTRNEMTAARLLIAEHTFEVTGSGYLPEGELRMSGERVEIAEHPVLGEVALGSLLCNDAELRQRGDPGEWRLQGDPTEGALLVLGEKLGLEREVVIRDHARIDEIPFESENRYMATLTEHRTGRRIWVKGAPERIFEMCGQVRTPEGDQPLDAQAWKERIDTIAAEGFRMLAVATAEAKPGQSRLTEGEVASGLTLLGVVGLIDPPRSEAIEAVAECRRAGIRVKMITGDHALTARSIANQLGIGNGDARAITGQDIEQANDDELVRIAHEHDVFARSSPEHKLRLVRALQSRGEVTAMTGDGVNDAPALKQADIGVAMGIKGSEASKSAAEMVLADDNFATIERAVEEGRTVYDNLKKTILFILPTNGAEGLMVITAVLFAFAELPLTPVQILWVNMITAVTLALALAFESAEPGVMRRPPRPREEPILSGYLLWRIAFVSVIVAAGCLYLFYRELDAGRSPEAARTLAVNALVAAEAFYLFNARFIHERSYGVRRMISNRVALLAVALLVLFQAVFTYVPIFQIWFGTEGLEPHDWIWVVGLGVVVFVIVEVEKAVIRRVRAPA